MVNIQMVMKVFITILLLVFSRDLTAKDIEIYPKTETDPVYTDGDAADDPAFWFNSKNPLKSIIFGTDKKAGLHSFSLDGKRLQFIPSGRIKDDKNIKIKSGLRDIINKFKPSVTLSTDQNIILGDINEKDKNVIDILLKEHLIVKKKLSDVDRWFLACPALPTCGLALSEAERVREELIRKINAVLLKHNLHNEKFSIRITGCPNGCARPYAGDIGIVGRAPNLYALYSGGDFEGTRLNKKILDKVSYDDLTKALEQIFLLFKDKKQNNESLGDFCNRIGTHAQFVKIKEVLDDKVQ